MSLPRSIYLERTTLPPPSSEKLDFEAHDKPPKPPKPYAGPNRRNNDRYELSRENQELVNVLTRKMRCTDHCVISDEIRSNLPKHYDSIKNIGSGNIPRGINRKEEQYRRVDSILNTWHDIGKITLKVIVVIIVTAVASWFIIGFLAKLKQGMGI